MSDDYGIINLIVSVYKDIVEKELLNKIEQEYNQVMLTESKARRMKSDALIKQMHELKMALKKFEYTYAKIQRNCGIAIPEVDKYIADINYKIKKASYEKNNLR